jgi:hypothetical protein
MPPGSDPGAPPLSYETSIEIWSALRESNPAVYGDLPLRVYKAQPHASANAGNSFVARMEARSAVIRERSFPHSDRAP